MSDSLERTLRNFGAPAGSVLRLSEPGPRLLRYADLLGPAARGKPRPDCVVEVQRRPVLYVVQGPVPPEELRRLRDILAVRDGAEYLGVLQHGRLTLYPLVLRKDAPVQAEEVSSDTREARTLVSRLALGMPKAGVNTKAVHQRLFELLDATTQALVDENLHPSDALSLAGRAVFLRFLWDREVIRKEDLGDVCPGAGKIEDCLKSPRNAYRTFRWLDHTFNGNLLPLSGGGVLAWFSDLTDTVYLELTKILHRAAPSGQLEFDWGDIDFGHVPVGLLSQVYERHCRRFEDRAHRESVHYTPRYIAEYMVDEAFDSMEDGAAARVLDPAAGAGVFLVAAFRRLVAERWARDGRPPETAVLREILYTQLAGFDINESALRLAALSLYLTALELDPHPTPLEKLRFEDLRGRVLFDVRTPAERRAGAPATAVAGSLGRGVPDGHRGRYDLVVGNPPWTGLKKEEREVARSWVEVVRPIVRERLGDERAAAFRLPDLVPDIPFVWRACEWARPGGHIALALHARLLFKQSAQGEEARRALFDAVRVTGILNGAALRETPVWPEISAPFCLVFAINEVPSPESSFYFVSPQFQASLNERGALRVDAKSASPVLWSEWRERPSLIKTLFCGTELDVRVVERLQAEANPPLLDYWAKTLGLKTGKGYLIGGDDAPQHSAKMLCGLPDLGGEVGAPTFVLDAAAIKRLPLFDRPTLTRPRKRDLYRSPMVLVKRSPPRDAANGRALLVFSDVAFPEGFIGFSAAGYPQAEALARYLHLVLCSDLPLYFALMTSSQFGVERDAFYKEDLDQFPIVPFERLPAGSAASARELSRALQHQEGGALDDVNDWVARCYGLRRQDIEVIRDTLSASLPFPKVVRDAQLPPSPEEEEQFVHRLREVLSRQLEAFGIGVDVGVVDALEPWGLVGIQAAAGKRAPLTPPPAATLSRLLAEASSLGASEVVVHGRQPGQVWLGILRQRRYWTRTRARLAAVTLLQEHERALLKGAA